MPCVELRVDGGVAELVRSATRKGRELDDHDQRFFSEVFVRRT
jgi:hypothetical protein